jgi:hypothetical protein
VVFDDDRLADGLAERRADETRQRVDAAARRKRDDEPDRSRRVGLREGRRR